MRKIAMSTRRRGKYPYTITVWKSEHNGGRPRGGKGGLRTWLYFVRRDQALLKLLLNLLLLVCLEHHQCAETTSKNFSRAVLDFQSFLFNIRHKIGFQNSNLMLWIFLQTCLRWLHRALEIMSFFSSFFAVLNATKTGKKSATHFIPQNYRIGPFQGF